MVAGVDALAPAAAAAAAAPPGVIASEGARAATAAAAAEEPLLLKTAFLAGSVVVFVFLIFDQLVSVCVREREKEKEGEASQGRRGEREITRETVPTFPLFFRSSHL